tara:strand:- start:704 stop:1159 length:456 start_codon:yes stop_codon:yes gene_type:complete
MTISFSANSQTESDPNVFLSIDHGKNRSEFVIDKKYRGIVETENGALMVAELEGLINPYRDLSEYSKFLKLDFDSSRVFFDMKGNFLNLVLTKNRQNLNGTFEKNMVIDLLDKRFGVHIYFDGMYIWENSAIKISSGFDEDGDLFIVSQPK